MSKLIIGIAGLVLQNEEIELLQHDLIAGVILFRRNYKSKSQLKVLTEQIKKVKNPTLTIYVDQEGGSVQRFVDEFAVLPALKNLGDVYDANAKAGLKMAYEQGALTARELKECGVDVNFSPVVDLYNENSKIINERAFHADPMVVGLLSESYIQGMEDVGIAGVIKHFPGHGSIEGDTHLTKVIDKRHLAMIKNTDLKPFVYLINKGVLSIMASHIIFPEIDSLPAGLSKIWLQDILRGELNFKGTIISDDMGMEGVCHFDVVKRCGLAKTAGCDLIILGNEQIPTVKKVLNAVQ